MLGVLTCADGAALAGRLDGGHAAVDGRAAHGVAAQRAVHAAAHVARLECTQTTFYHIYYVWSALG